MFKVLMVNLFLITSLFGDWKGLKQELRSVIRSGKATEVRQKIEECAKYDQEDTAEFLGSILRSSKTPLLYKMTISRVLSGFENENARKLMLGKINSKNYGHYFLQALTSKQDKISERACEIIIKNSSDQQLLTIAIRGLGRFKDYGNKGIISAIVVKLGKDNHLTVRRAAVEALGSFGRTDLAPVLLQLILHKEVRDYAIDSLQRLTGQKFGYDPSSWRKWLKDNKDFIPVNTPLDEYQQAMFDIKEKNRQKHDSNFYGIEIEASRILFLLDKSASMNNKTNYDTRLVDLKKEFNNMLKQLEEDKRMGLVWFSGNITFPRKKIAKVTEPFKKDVRKHLEDIEASGDTPLGESVIHVFENVIPDNGIEAIYILSDGSPTDIEEDELRKLIKKLNEKTFIKIHTISIGRNSSFMKNIAKDNYGSYVEVK